MSYRVFSKLHSRQSMTYYCYEHIRHGKDMSKHPISSYHPYQAIANFILSASVISTSHTARKPTECTAGETTPFVTTQYRRITSIDVHLETPHPRTFTAPNRPESSTSVQYGKIQLQTPANDGEKVSEKPSITIHAFGSHGTGLPRQRVGAIVAYVWELRANVSLNLRFILWKYAHRLASGR